MKKHRVKGEYAPPARPKPAVIMVILVNLAAVIVLLGLAVDPYLAPIFVTR